MQTAIAILGFISWILLAIGLLFVLFNVSCFFAEKLVSKIQRDSKDALKAEIANDMLNNAWWFSESVEAMAILSIYGKAMTTDYRPCASRMRADWRTEIAKNQVK